MTKITKGLVAAIIPAINEEVVIDQTLIALLEQLDSSDIYVIDDGSTDKTSLVAKRFTENVLTSPNQGKARALNSALEYYDIVNRYKYIFFMDADTTPKSDFLDLVLKHFYEDKKEKVACVVGRVQGIGGTWISKYRLWEYEISHSIHKRAQSIVGSILVVPGCATVYRSKIFKSVNFPTGTITEDMDFTFLLHRQGFSKMIYENKALVYTQDPQVLSDFIIQINRWYLGFWQAVRKHDIPWQGQSLDFEVGLLALEGLYNGILVSLFIFFSPVLVIRHVYSVLLIPFIIDLFLFFIPTLVWVSIKNRDFSLLLYIFHFYFVRFLSAIMFLKSFFQGFVSSEKDYSWDTNRYIVKKKGV